MDFFDKYGFDKYYIGVYDFDKLGVAFSEDRKDLVKCPKDFRGEYVIPDGVTKIRNEAFLGCCGLTSITIPNSVTSIGNMAFYYCTALTKVSIPKSVTSIGFAAFQDCSSLTSVHIKDLTAWCRISFDLSYASNPLVYAHHLYLNGVEIKNLLIPNGITNIGDCAFIGCSLSAVIIPSSITCIGHEVFRYCKKLSSIEIPNSVINIGEAAFQDCSNLIEINVAEGNLNYSSANGVLFDKDKTTLVQFPVGKQGDYVIPNSVTSIGDKAFYGCSGLTSVTIPNSVTSIGISAFAGCSSLTSVTIPNSVTSIGVLAFDRCENLKKIIVPLGPKERFAQMDGLRDFADIIGQTSEKQIEQLRQQEREAQEQQRLQAQQMQEMLQDSILFFDTETTGVPILYNAPVTNSANWPRLVQLAWIMADKNGNILKRKSVIIKPDGFTIPSDASAVHGITTERALREGQPLDVVMNEFINDVQLAASVVGHNIDFDMHIVGAELYRLDKNYDLLMDKPCTCTMKSSTDFCAIPNPNSYYGGYKWPSLQELYRKLFNRDFTDAHDALADISATKECFFELKQRGII